MVDYFVKQTGTGAVDGTSIADAWGYANITWSSLTDNDLYIIGDITNAFSIGAHSSTAATSPFQLRGDYAGNAGRLRGSGGSALTIPANTNRNHTHIRGLDINSTAGRGVLVNSGVGVVGRRFYSCIISNNTTQGVRFDTTAGDDLTDLVFDGNTISSNATYAVQLDIGGAGETFSVTDITCVDNITHLNGSDCWRILLNSGNVSDGTIDNFLFDNNLMYNNGMTNGGRGLRFGAATHTQTTGRGAIITNNVAIGNGRNGNQGGGLDIRSGAGDPAGSIGDTDECYIAYNIASGNHGENGGINVYGVLNGTVEWNICDDQFVSELDNVGPDPTIDGNGIIMDANSDSMECRYNSCSRNRGSSANNSGVGIMVLFSVDELRVHHNFGYGNKYGLWTAHKSGSPQTDIEFSNNTFLDCDKDGFWSGTGSPAQNTVRNNIFTGNPATSEYGVWNADGTNLSDEDYNIFYNFNTAASGSNGGLGTNSLTTEPIFEADIEHEDDFSGTASVTLDAGGNLAWDITSAGGDDVEGERVIEFDGSGGISSQNNGGGSSGVQTMYLAPDDNDPNHWIEMTVDAGWTTSTSGVMGFLRYTDKDNCIVLRIQGTGATGLVVKTRIAGSETTILSAQPTVGSVYRVECFTEYVALYKDDVQQPITSADPAYAPDDSGNARVLATDLDPLTTRVGMGAFHNNANVQWSNFKSGVLLPNMKPSTPSVVQMGSGTPETYAVDPDGNIHDSASWPIGAWDLVAGSSPVVVGTQPSRLFLMGIG